MRLPGDFARSDSGAALATSLLWLVMILGLSGIAIDTASAYRERAMMQAAADAAATAGALELPDVSAAKNVALDYLEANLPKARHGETARREDVLVGTWDEQAGRFEEGAPPLDALAIRLRRSSENGNPLPTFILGMFGFEAWNLGVRSVARAPWPCQSLRANGKVMMRKEATLGPGVCVYGREGVELEHWSLAEAGSRIGMLDTAAFVPGKDSVIASGVLFEEDLRPLRALKVAETIDAWEAGRRTPPGWVARVVADLPDAPEPDTIYIVDGDLRVSNSFTLTDAVVAVRGNLQIMKGGSLNSATGCGTGRPVGVYVTGDISLDKEASVNGADIVAGGRVYADKDIAGVDAVIEAGGDIELKKMPTFSACRAQRAPFGLEGTQIVY